MVPDLAVPVLFLLSKTRDSQQIVTQNHMLIQSPSNCVSHARSWHIKSDGEFVTTFQQTPQSLSLDVLIFFGLLMGNEYDNGVCLCQYYLNKSNQF